MITIKCYGKEVSWNNRQKAMDSYHDAMMGCDPSSSEYSRYSNIFYGLIAGFNYITDGE